MNIVLLVASCGFAESGRKMARHVVMSFQN